MVVTDGRCWQVYETHFLAGTDEQPSMQFDVCCPAAEVARLAGFLERSTLVEAARPLMVTESDTATPVSESLDYLLYMSRSGTPERSPAYLVVPQSSDGPLAVWHRIPLVSWADLDEQLVRHLAETGKLEPSHCPIRNVRSTKRSLVDCVYWHQYHPQAETFRQPKQVKGAWGTFWVETKHDQKHHIENMLTVLAAVGEDSSRYGLVWED